MRPSSWRGRPTSRQRLLSADARILRASWASLHACRTDWPAPSPEFAAILSVCSGARRAEFGMARSLVAPLWLLGVTPDRWAQSAPRRPLDSVPPDFPLSNPRTL